MRRPFLVPVSTDGLSFVPKPWTCTGSGVGVAGPGAAEPLELDALGGPPPAGRSAHAHARSAHARSTPAAGAPSLVRRIGRPREPFGPRGRKRERYDLEAEREEEADRIDADVDQQRQ